MTLFTHNFPFFLIDASEWCVCMCEYVLVRDCVSVYLFWCDVDIVVWTAWTRCLFAIFLLFYHPLSVSISSHSIFLSFFHCILFQRISFFFLCPICRFVGLSMEELCIYLDDPWWRLLRRGIMISLCVLLFAIFASACIISIVEYDMQRCHISSMKSPIFSAINSISADTISRTNYTLLSTNAMASNGSTAAAYNINASTMQWLCVRVCVQHRFRYTLKWWNAF